MMPATGLSAAQRAAFARDGYVVVRQALAATTVAGLLAETQRLLGTLSLATHPGTRFATGAAGGGAHVGDDYFLTSGDQVRFFLEEQQGEGEGEGGGAPAVNKIGHGLHLRSGPFRALTAPAPARDGAGAGAGAGDGDGDGPGDGRPAAIARDLGFRDPRCLQSMVICKPAGVGGAVPPHQDSTFLYTRPPSAVGFWYALQDARRANGCLAVLPGSHRWAPVAARLVRGPAGGTEMLPNDDDGPRFPPGTALLPPPPPLPAGDDDAAAAAAADGAAADGGGGGGAHAHDDAAYVPLEVDAGDLVLLHGNLLHRSERNTSDKGRIIYTFHIIEGDGATYDERNWLQPPAEGFARLYA